MSARTVSLRRHGADPEPFVRAGWSARHVIAHDAVLVPRAAPDGRVIAQACGLDPEPGELYQVILWADDDTAAVDDDLWFDPEIMWHGQHLGRRGQFATAGIVWRGDRMWTTAHHSDVVQRIGRRRALKTQVEKRFSGWDRLLVNAILAFAVELGVRIVRLPTASTALANTDPARDPGPELFERIYDRHVVDTYRVIEHGGWWELDVAANGDLVVGGTRIVESLPDGPTLAVSHDVEAGHGHIDCEPDFVAEADRASPHALSAMLDLEDDVGVRATYDVLGTLFGEVAPSIRARGHCLGFHTWDHHIETWRHRAHRRVARATRGRLGSPPPVAAADQPGRCRGVDPQVYGYRPAQSVLGADTDRRRLAAHNYAWLASSAASLGHDRPQLRDGIVGIPIARDDHALHVGRSYADWESDVLAAARNTDVFVLSLHDCYGPRWLPRYRELLVALSSGRRVVTFDDLAAEEVLASAL